MKKFRFLLFVLFLLCFSCNRTDDPVVAEVYEHKLYVSDVQKLMSDYVTGKDSVEMAQKIIDDWRAKYLLLHEAQQTLSLSEKDFSKEMADYRDELMIRAYFEKITSDTTLFPVSDAEIRAFMHQYAMNPSEEKEIVRLNYVKLSKKSKLIPQIREILSDEAKRKSGKMQIETLCADSVEYFIEDEQWLYLDEIEFEFPIQLSGETNPIRKNQLIESEDAGYHYLVVLLDYRKRATTDIVASSEYESVKNLLRQQKKNAYVQQKIAELK